MVLQRDARITVWGSADPGEQVRIEFRGETATAQADRQGRWSGSLGPFPAGGPYEMVVAGRNRLTLHDILLGDVWLASGQSNMEAPVAPDESWGWKGINNAQSEVARAAFQQIRLLKVHHRIGLRDSPDVEADAWTPVTAETVRAFSAVAYLFGREIHQRYRVPVGVIQSTWGGTLAEAWVSAGALRRFPEFRQSIDSLREIDEDTAIAEHRDYEKQRADWFGKHGDEDRGRRDSKYFWAAPDLDTSDWPVVDQPQTEPIEALNGFDGTVWFRKEINLPPESAGREIQLHLGIAYKDDVTFFNGTKVGETRGEARKDYVVPGSLVKPGRNILAIRLTGDVGFVGLYGDTAKLGLESAGQAISLAGSWSYKPGPDLRDLPKAPVYTKLSWDPAAPTVLFNGMISPLTQYAIRGVIWYQGEANAERKRSAQYRQLFPALIQDWRAHWGYEFPFLFVQLAGWGANQAEPADYSWAELREAQAMTLKVPNTGMATAVDIGDPEDIHPTDKQTLAHRLALVAAKVAYGANLIDSGPTYRSMHVEGNRVRITFSNVGSGLRTNDKHDQIRGFEIAGSDGRFRWAHARIEGQALVVFSEQVSHPIAVRYDWRNTPDGNVYNVEGFPATPFRTDGPTP
jgi:sialate O-acetylesterase